MREFFVVFRNCDERYWWTRVFRSGFEHCFVIQAQPGCSLAVNPRIHGMEVHVAGHSAIETLLDVWREGDTVVTVNWPEMGYDMPRRWPVLSCATVVAYFIGLPHWCPTPYSLYRRLIRLGGKELGHTGEGIRI